MSKISAFFERLFRNSLFLKILSVIIAIGIWLYIVNVADPRRSEEYTNVPISFVYEGTVPYNNSLMPLVTSRSFFVNLRVSGPRTSLMNYSKDKISASLNFNSVAAEGIYEVPISISLGDDSLTYEILGSDSITLEFVKKSSTTLRVDVKSSGTFKTGYSVVEQTVSPETITVEGPKSVVDTISFAEVLIDVTNAEKNIVESGDILLLTSDRAYVDRTYLSLSPSQATVSVALQYRKSVKISTSLLNPYGGDETPYATVSYSPSPYLQLQGEEDVLSYIDTYNIGSINLAEVTDSKKTFDFTVQNQSGIEVVSDSKTVTVTVDLGNAETKTFRLSSANLQNASFLNVPEGKVARITDLYKVITLRAQDYTLAEIFPDSFRLSVDLSSVPNENGEYQLKVELPSGVYGGFMNRYYVNVAIEDVQ
jgi:YbbR domain-containing protein